MVTLEQVSRRVFADSSWLIKTLVGTILLVVPPLALGYIYRVAEQGRQGRLPDLPDWDDWRGLFVDGLRFLLLLVVLTAVPIFLAWAFAGLLSWLFQGLPFFWAFSQFLYLPLVPISILAPPLTAASLYRYQRRWDFNDAFRFPALFRMVVATKGRFVIPTLAYIGLLVVLLPVLPYALFTGGVVVFHYYALIFHQTEAASRSGASGQSRLDR